MSDKISLKEAMNVTSNMTPSQVSTQWKSWKSAYPNDVRNLSPSVVASLDTMSDIITAYDTIVTTITTVEKAYTIAVTSYKLGLSLLPGIGALDAAQQAAGEAVKALYNSSAELAKQLYQQAINMVEALVNTQVPKNDRI